MIVETTLENMLGSYDWEEVFKYASPIAVLGATVDTSSFDLASVKKVIGSVEGENDGDAWVAVFELNDGRFACIRADCDYTGWG